MRPLMFRSARAMLLGAVISMLGHAPAAQAQMAEALGKPLAVADLEVGTVTVRVIAGQPNKPVGATEVKLKSSDGTERIARTDPEGRATFTNLQPGTQWVASAAEPAQEGEARKEGSSEEFTIPQSGGLRIMLSTKPWADGAAGGAAANGGMQPMLNPRQMSGMPRPDPQDPARVLTVSALQGGLGNRVAGHPIHLIGYGADGSVTKLTQTTDAGGRARFENLAVGNVAYYAITSYRRGSEQAPIVDRLGSQPIMMPPQVGVRLLLAGLGRDSSEPAVDDLQAMIDQSGLPAGAVNVMIIGFADGSFDVDLYEITDSGPVLVKEAPPGAPMPSDVRATFRGPAPSATLAAGAVAIEVTGNGEPLRDATVTLVPTGPGQAGQAAPLSSRTNAQGKAEFTGLAPATEYRAVFGLYGESFQSEPIVVPQSGGMELGIAVTWREGEAPEARFEGIAGDKLYFAEVVYQGKPLRSMPFYMAPDRGARVNVIVTPQTVFFSVLLAAELDQEYLGFSGQFTMTNYSYMPWDPGPEGLLIPLPKGFVGAGVREEMEHMVKVDPERGFVWRSALPPSSVQFFGGFSLKLQDGAVDYHMDLPLGLFQSSIILFKYGNTEVVNLPPGVRPVPDRTRDGGKEVWVLNVSSIQAGQSMVFRVIGLPERSMSERVIAWIAGGIVFAILCWGIGGVLWQRSRKGVAGTGVARLKADADDKSKTKKLGKRREQLLDELVAIEAKKKSGDIAEDVYARERAKLKKQLEAVYAELKEAHESDGPRAA